MKLYGLSIVCFFASFVLFPLSAFAFSYTAAPVSGDATTAILWSTDDLSATDITFFFSDGVTFNGPLPLTNDGTNAYIDNSFNDINGGDFCGSNPGQCFSGNIATGYFTNGTCTDLPTCESTALGSGTYMFEFPQPATSTATTTLDQIGSAAVFIWSGILAYFIGLIATVWIYWLVV